MHPNKNNPEIRCDIIRIYAVDVEQEEKETGVELVPYRPEPQDAWAILNHEVCIARNNPELDAAAKKAEPGDLIGILVVEHDVLSVQRLFINALLG